MANFIENRGASVCPPRTHRNDFRRVFLGGLLSSMARLRFL